MPPPAPRHPRWARARDIESTTARHTPLHANVDLALAVFTASWGMDATAGDPADGLAIWGTSDLTDFAVARTAGRTAHTLEEYEERPLRMRPRGRYARARPPQPLPE